MEILHGEIQRKLPEFEAIIMHKSDPATYLWNGTTTGDCTCLLVQTGENWTPVHAFIRKMSSRGETVADKQTGEEYHVK